MRVIHYILKLWKKINICLSPFPRIFHLVSSIFFNYVHFYIFKKNALILAVKRLKPVQIYTFPHFFCSTSVVAFVQAYIWIKTYIIMFHPKTQFFFVVRLNKVFKNPSGNTRCIRYNYDSNSAVIVVKVFVALNTFTISNAINKITQ